MNGNSDISQWTLSMLPLQPLFARVGQLRLIVKIVSRRNAYYCSIANASEPESNRTTG